MAKAEIHPGNCGFKTTIEARDDGRLCKISIVSECAASQRLAQELTEVNPMQEISFRRGMPRALELGAKYCSHTACPVPIGIIKTVEVEAGLALPGEATIKVDKTP